jgi:predicted small lipoprotein YifL
VRWIFVLLLTLQALTCGQKGPLILPPDSSASTGTLLQQENRVETAIQPTN